MDERDRARGPGGAAVAVPHVRACVLMAGVLLAGCAYDPPVQADHAAPKYEADLAKCRKQAALAAGRIANATPQSSIRSLFASDEPERQDIRECMRGRGYR